MPLLNVIVIEVEFNQPSSNVCRKYLIRFLSSTRPCGSFKVAFDFCGDHAILKPKMRSRDLNRLTCVYIALCKDSLSIKDSALFDDLKGVNLEKGRSSVVQNAANFSKVQEMRRKKEVHSM